MGSDNLINNSHSTVVLGSANQIKGAIKRADSNWDAVTAKDVNILGKNNVIQGALDVDTLAIFGSNFKLTSEEQVQNAYYIGNPFLSGTSDAALARLFVAADGGAYFTGDVISFALSDKRHKGSVATIENPLDKIAKIRGITFEWKDSQKVYSGKDVGVIAQEIEKVLPEVVEDRVIGKGVKYEKITPLLIEGIKAQQELIDSLTERVADLESAINKLQ